ncbi:MAG: signal peptidase I [Thermoleophilia bacterium]
MIKRIAAYFATSIVAIVLLAFLGLFLMSVPVADSIPLVGDYEPMIVQSGSMEPGMAVGGIVLVDKRIAPVDIEVGDVITFRTPQQQSQTLSYTTHRVTAVDYENDKRVFETKGDANEDVDSWVVPADSVLGQEVLSVPYLGYFVRYVKSPMGFMAVVVFPALIVIAMELRKIFVDVSKRETADASE